MHGRGAIVAALATHAFITTSIGARMPAIRDQTGLDAPSLGLALGGYAVALLLGTRLAERFVTRFGSRDVVRVGTPLLCLSLIPVGLADDLPTLALTLVCLGLLSGGLDVAINSYAVELERRLSRPILSGIHAAWSAGMLVAAGLAAVVVAAGLPPLAHFTGLGLSLAVLSSLFLNRLDEMRPTTVAQSDVDRVDRRLLLVPILTLGAIGFVSFVNEGTIIDWGVIYLEDAGRVAPTVAILAYVANALGMLTSRLLGDKMVTIAGPVPLVRWAGVATAVALGCVILRPDPVVGVAAYAVIGFANGPVFPIALSAAGNRGPGQTMVVGWVVTLAYLGSVVGPMVIGFVAGSSGLQAAFLFPMILGSVLVLLAPVVRDAARGSRPATVSPAEMPPL